MILSLPIIIYYNFHPVLLAGSVGSAYSNTMGWEPLLCFSVEPGFFINQSLIVFMIVILAIIYPISRIGKLNIINALRSK